MPFCTIEEAWGENIYKPSTESSNNTDNLYKENITFTDKIPSNKRKRHTSKKHKKNSQKKTDINDYIDTLKKENEELRNTITSLKENLDTLYKNGSNDSQMNKYIKMGIIDIILYILTGIFIIFIIDLILKYNTKTTTISLENVF
tara:strand:+ start:52 stop:486 length:435 start_codon:yes stop_codon:yes gene_type:complete